MNGDGIIDLGSNTLSDPGDRTVIGNTTPRYRFNLQGGIGWHGFEVRAIFEGLLKETYGLVVILFGDFQEVFTIPMYSNII